MAVSFDINEPSSIGSSIRTRRPSLHAAFTIARLVQSFRGRLKSRVVKSKFSDQTAITSSALNQPQRQRSVADSDSERHWPTSRFAAPAFTSSLKDHPTDDEDMIVDDIHATNLSRKKPADNILSLIEKLDIFAQPRTVSTATIANDDTLFLQYDPRHDVASRNITTLGKILDTSTAILDRLQHCSTSVAAYASEFSDTVVPTYCGGPICQKAVANLEHILRCLQYSALEALADCYSKVMEAEFVHWHLYWQRWQTGDTWFTEWPGGRRPYNTTWPWDVKVSLLVLWGVCWMFYGNGMPRKPQAAEFFSANFGTGQPPRQPPHPNFSPTTSNSEGWTSTGITDLQYPIESHPPAEPLSRHANCISDYYTLPAFSNCVSSSSYISISPATSSASFVTPTPFWPRNQGINSPASGYAYSPGYNLHLGSRPQHERISDLTSSIRNLEPSKPVNLYAAPYHPAITNELGGNVAEAGPNQGQPHSIMPGYPSPHSDMSDHRVSPCPSVFPATNMTLATVPYTATSRASSTYGSPQSAKSEEPIRNDEGVMYCNHKQCAQLPDGPPTFTRKCEWSKHMDKHNRPYVCEERGCEKIQGFTYSGGLLRHQREVHRQHGGPKASCMCPHRDCKRSTGVGFSRRENLVEHLRRVHRGVGGESTNAPLAPGSKERKRRRVQNDEEKEECKDASEQAKRRKTAEEEDAAKAMLPAAEPNDLRAQVKQLKLELQQRDERLRKLEETVARLAGDQ